MKRIIIVMCIFIGLSLFPKESSADSPLTSTDFYLAYDDIDIVRRASESGKVNKNIAKYLYDADNPLDIKAAVINALSWDIDGKTNADSYCKLIYKKSLKNIGFDELRADQQFCIGYMLALDNYSNVETALRYLKIAEKSLPNSFTVSIIRALIEMMEMDENSWYIIQDVLNNSKLTVDIREDAINIILDYMALYNDSNIIVNHNDLLIENGETQIVYLYGTSYFYGDSPCIIDQGSEKVSAAICKDKYGIFYLKLTGIENGNSYIVIKNDYDKKVIIYFNVISNEVFKILDHSMALYVDDRDSLIYNTRATIKKEFFPYIINGEPYVPLEFMCKSIDGKFTYNKKQEKSRYSYSSTEIEFTNNSKYVRVNGEKQKLSSKIIFKSNQQFISAKDLAGLLNYKYIYYNDLIMFVSSDIAIDIILDAYILDEISWIISQNNKLTNYLTPVFMNGIFGYEDSTGEVIIEPMYEYAYEFNDGLAIVTVIDYSDTTEFSTELYGVIDEKGSYVIPPIYDWIGDYSNGIMPVRKGGKAGVIDRNGTYIIEPIYDWIGDYSNGLMPVGKDGKVGFIDEKGNIKIPLQYKDAYSFENGIAPVLNEEGTKWGYIDLEGKLVIPYLYDDCYQFSEGLASIKIDGKWGYIDRSGNIIIEPKYDNAYFTINGLSYVSLQDKYYYITRSGLRVDYSYYGDVYVGEYNKHGYLTGKGVYTDASGNQYTGDFVNGLYHGKGTKTWICGDQYTGDWLIGIKTGKGTYTWNNGNQYTGDWLFGEITGKGTFTWNDDVQYTGEFVNGYLEGQGKMTYPDGRIYDGYWEKSYFIGEK